MPRIKNKVIVWRAIALAVILPLTAGAQEKAYSFRFSNLTLEFYGGYAPFTPGDLNIIAAHEGASLQFAYIQKYNAFAQLGYNVSLERNGDETFRPIKRGVPWGARVRYQLSPTLALSFGVQCFMARQDSHVSLTAILRDSSNNILFTDRYDNQGFALALKAWQPQVGVHFGWNIGRLFRSEIFIAGGPMYTEVRAASDVRTTITVWTGDQAESTRAVEIKGTSRSWAFELGTIFRIHPARLFDLFVEASYTSREAQEFDGPGKGTNPWIVPAGSPKTSEESWQGRWRVLELTTYTNAGTFTTTTVTNDNSQRGMYERNFSLRSSGLQLKFGLGFHL